MISLFSSARLLWRRSRGRRDPYLRAFALILPLALLGFGLAGCRPQQSSIDPATHGSPALLQQLGVEDCPAGSNIIIGTEGDDSIVGTSGDDCIVALGGNDEIDATSGGNDVIFAGDGDDTIYAGNGSDIIYGEGGSDWIFAGNGGDYIDGGDGNDFLYGDNGNDQIMGGAGDDFIVGGRGDDYLIGGDGDDLLLGYRGDDTCVDEGSTSGCEVVISPAAVSLVDARAEPCATGVCLQWTTGFEYHNRGFALYRFGKTGWQRLNPELIPGAGDQVTPRSYSWTDPQGQAGDLYRIEDWDFSAQRRRHPSIKAQNGPRRPELRLQEKKIGVSSPKALALPLRSLLVQALQPGAARQFAIQGRGLFVFDSADLGPGQGWAFRQHDQVLLSLNQADKTLLWTYAKSNRDADFDVVRAQRGRAQEMPSRALHACAQGVSQAQVGLHLEQDLEYVVSRPFDQLVGDPDPFVWTHLMTGQVANLSFAAPQRRDDQPAQIKIHIAGTATGSVPNHLVELSLNGVLLDTVDWDGPAPETLSLDIPAGLLQSQDNLLQVSSPRSDFDYLYVDAVDLNYSRALVADGPGFAFVASPAQCVMLRWDGHTAPPFVLDVSDPQRPVHLLLPQAHLDRVGRAWVQVLAPSSRVRPGQAAAPRRLWVQGADALNSLRLQGPVHKLALHQVDYLAIAQPSMLREAQRLVDWHAATGLSVQLLSSQQIYDSYSGGQPDAQAFGKLMQAYFARFGALPKQVLLVGAASVGVPVSGAAGDLLPTAFRVDDVYSYEAASDDTLLGLSDFPESQRPAVGRLPFIDVEQARAVVDKLLAWYAQPAVPSRSVLSLADRGSVDETGRIGFGQFATGVNQKYQRLNLATDVLDFGQSADPASLLHTALEADASPDLVQYFGHAFVSGWSSPQVLDGTDAAALTNPRLFALLSWACFDGSFVGPWGESLAWSLVANPQGGAYAALASASLTDPSDSLVVASAFGTALLQAQSAQAQGDLSPLPLSFGAAVRQAKNILCAQSDELDQAMAAFNLIGDPAAPLPW